MPQITLTVDVRVVHGSISPVNGPKESGLNSHWPNHRLGVNFWLRMAHSPVKGKTTIRVNCGSTNSIQIYFEVNKTICRWHTIQLKKPKPKIRLQYLQNGDGRARAGNHNCDYTMMVFLLNRNSLPLNDFVIEPNHVTFKSQLCSSLDFLHCGLGYGVQLHICDVNAAAMHWATS